MLNFLVLNFERIFALKSFERVAFDILAECWHKLAKSSSGVRQSSDFQEQCLSYGIWTCVKNFVSSTLEARCRFPTKGKWDLPEQTRTNARGKDTIDKRNFEIVETFPLAPHVLPEVAFLGNRWMITKYVRLETLLRSLAGNKKKSFLNVHLYL